MCKISLKNVQNFIKIDTVGSDIRLDKHHDKSFLYNYK